MIRTLMTLAGLACTIAGVYSYATAATRPTQVQLERVASQSLKAQPVACTKKQKQECYAEFKCVTGDKKEREGCRMTRRQCLAGCSG